MSDLFRIKGFRFPRAVIGYAVWAHHRFALSLRDVEDLLASRGIRVASETGTGSRFGGQFDARIRCERPGPADNWDLDEVVISIKGKKHWLWRGSTPMAPLGRSHRDRLPRRGFAGYPGSVASEHERRQVLLSNAVPAMGPAARAGHGQARVLSRGPSRDRPWGRTSPAQGVEQSGRSLAPVHPATREDHGAVQVPGSGATVPLNA